MVVTTLYKKWNSYLKIVRHLNKTLECNLWWLATTVYSRYLTILQNKWNRVWQTLIGHLPWIITPVHRINFCQVTTKCSSCSHLYSTNWFDIMCYLEERQFQECYWQQYSIFTNMWGKKTSKQKEQHTKMQAQSIYNDVRTRNMNFVKEPNT